MAPAAVAAEDQLFAFDALGHDGSTVVNSAKVRFLVDGALSGGIVPGAMTVSMTIVAGV